MRHLAILVLALPLFAQTTASLTGTVASSSGQPIAGATFIAPSPALQGMRVTVTGDAGVYPFDALPRGRYSLKVEEGGMTAQEWANVRLSQTSRVDVVLKSEAEMTVHAQTPPALELPEVSTNFTLQQIERLPVPRNQLATAQFAPGVTANVLTNGQLQISGGPGYDNLVLVNGVVVTENVRGQIRPMYVEDAIQETTLLTGALSAECGGFSGGG